MCAKRQWGEAQSKQRLAGCWLRVRDFVFFWLWWVWPRGALCVRMWCFVCVCVWMYVRGGVGLCVCTGPTGVFIYFFFPFNPIKLLDRIGFDLIQIQFDRIDKKSYNRITLLIHIRFEYEIFISDWVVLFAHP